MASVQPHPYDLIGSELRTLAQDEGPGLWRNRSRLMGLLLDHQPELRREIRSVVSGVEQGVARALSEADRSLAAITIDRQASLMETEVGLRPDVAQNVTRAIAHALDLGPLPSVYPQSRPHVSDQRFPPSPAPAPEAAPIWHDPHSSQRRPPVPPNPGETGARRFPWPAAILGGAVLAAGAIVMLPQLQGTGSPVPGNGPMAEGNPPRQGAGQMPVQAAANGGYGEELKDFGIPAQATLQPNVGGPTPLDIPAGRRVTTEELRALIDRDPKALLIDVLASPHPATLQNARYVPVAGLPGTLTDQSQRQLTAILEDLTGGDKAQALVFFCAGAACWESYNAVIRADALGYSNLYWYRGGLFSWQQAGLPMQPVPAQETSNG
jgi:PQQ-dependent catabolism-associated CXXCW motif protein